MSMESSNGDPDANLEATGEVAAEPSFEEAAEQQGGTLAYGRGEALSDLEALDVTARFPTTVVVFAGAVGSGKTTIMAALYERFGRGPIAGQLFAGSQTLPGFERRCHGGRSASGHHHAHTPHTSLDAVPWLHLRLRPVELQAPARDLLLGDFYGERFDRLIAGTSMPSKMPFLTRADHICVTLDGARLADEVSRAGERQHALDLVAAVMASGQHVPGVVSLVVTKWDMVRRVGAEAQGAVDDLTEELVALCAETAQGSVVPVTLTAARSTISALPLGHGLEELVALWLARPTSQLSHPPPPTRLEGNAGFEAFNA